MLPDRSGLPLPGGEIMSASSRDIIYVEIEAESLAQDRDQTHAHPETYIAELLRMKAIIDILIARAATRV
jgi:hypothetical protein